MSMVPDDSVTMARAWPRGTKLRQYRSTLDPLNKRVLMKSGLSLNPETNRLEVDQARATEQMADKSPLVARQEGMLPQAEE